jgi:hypothetical protein
VAGPFRFQKRRSDDPERGRREGQPPDAPGTARTPFEESDTDVDKPVFKDRRSQLSSTFGPSVAAKTGADEERTDAGAPRSDPTMPRIPLATSEPGGLGIPTAIAVIIGALLGVALVVAYASDAGSNAAPSTREAGP